MKTYYFNTGVRPENVINFPYEYHRKVGNEIHGTLVIPFQCEDVPEGAKFLYACDELRIDKTRTDVIVRKIISGNLYSKYAYFGTN